MLSKGNIQEYLLERIQPGWTVVDVGANDGDTTLWMAQAAGPTGRVIAVEPDPRCYAALDTLALQHPQIVIERLACGAADGIRRLYRQGNSVQSSLYQVGAPDALDLTAPHLDVTVRRLDSLVLFADLVKIDVQGGDMDVLEGAPALLAICPEWVTELWPKGLTMAGVSPVAFVERLRAAGLTPLSVEPEPEPLDWDELLKYASLDHVGHEHINVAWRRI